MAKKTLIEFVAQLRSYNPFIEFIKNEFPDNHTSILNGDALSDTLEIKLSDSLESDFIYFLISNAECTNTKTTSGFLGAMMGGGGEITDIEAVQYGPLNWVIGIEESDIGYFDSLEEAFAYAKGHYCGMIDSYNDRNGVDEEK